MEDKFKKTYNRIVPNYEHLSKKMLDAAAYMVDHECTDPSGNPIIGEDRNILIYDKAYDAQLGSNLTKNEFLIAGALIGFGISISTFLIYKVIKKKKSKKS